MALAVHTESGWWLGSGPVMDDTRLPWMKFYPGDWLRDAALRTCSIAARGLWVELLCVMHANADRRGYLTLPTGLPMNSGHIARMVGISTQQADEYLAELEEAGVFSRDESGVIFSRRMVRDDNTLRANKENGMRGGNPMLKGGVKGGVNPPVNPPVNGGDKARCQKSDVRGQKSEGSQSSLGFSANTSSVSQGVVATDGGNPPPAAPQPVDTKCRWDPERGFVGIPASVRLAWEKAYPACDIDAELAKAHAWMQANPAKKKRNWTSFLRNWLDRSQERGGTIPSRRPTISTAPVGPPPLTLREVIDKARAENIAAARRNGTHEHR